MSKLPAGWTWVKVKELAQVQGGIQKQPKRRPDRNAHPFLRVANVLRNRLDLTEVHEVELFAGEIDRYHLQVGDLLVVEGNGSPSQIGRSAMWRGEIPECVHQNHLIRIRPQSCVLPKYLNYFWNSPSTMEQLGSIASSTSGLYVLTTAKVKAIEVPVAPLYEQERIVMALEEHFSRLAEGESLLDRARRNAARMRAAALGSITPRAKEWTTLGEIAELVGGVTKDSKRQADPAFVEVPYLRVANVQRGYLDLREITTIRVPPKKAKVLRLEPGDILFNEGGDRDKLGRGWVWSGEIDECIHQNHVFRARLLSPDFDAKFVSMHGNTFGQRWFEQMGKQTTNLASINLKTLKAFPVPAISVEEQRWVVADAERQLTILQSLTTGIDHALTRCEHLRRAILERAFTGRLVPQDPSDEPASVLLERTKTERVPGKGTRGQHRRVGTVTQ